MAIDNPGGIPRLRTAPEAVAEIKAADPDSALTVRAVRRLITSGTIKAVPVGNKLLINLDELICFLQGKTAPAANAGQIRRIS